MELATETNIVAYLSNSSSNMIFILCNAKDKLLNNREVFRAVEVEPD